MLILHYASLFIFIFVPVNFLLIYNFCKLNLIELRTELARRQETLCLTKEIFV